MLGRTKTPWLTPPNELQITQAGVSVKFLGSMRMV